MKNALLSGIVIGIFSGLWLFIMHKAGYDLNQSKVSPFEYISVLIPIIGLLIAIKDYRDNYLGGEMSFLEALVQSFKILIFGGILSIFAAIVYINWVYEGNNFEDFSGRMFGALLVGVLSALGVSLLYANKSNKLD
ncbi:DUF4199 domain-containing protein [Mucilaginibacter limnophilus]|uniref:DUF4199 domain-containing protein n=1 Tax=Mucilaginibacter limnophilus TaxID=1932778 RepID=A0A3S2Y1Q8_9SPHI|nr:DUF4199 domain-containing protein [Mucilaginibacter limnophilus]RVU01419.1 DUF4199 domain-containing protein [Mucilaginibacter limnophilus]